ncbi:ABC transporter permease [Amycolatopsis pigmentata]|uniref:ABC transporter permease n=1 Tax=Amycolatopsis pigmentata TaxID=450801 RepID=A0ABW5FI96_9PSEU
MVKTTLAGIKSRFGRLLLSSIAIIIGVAFVTGTLITGNGLDQSMRENFARQTRGVDVQVSADGVDEITPAVLDQIRKVPGVAAADGRTQTRLPLINSKGKAVEVTGYSLEGDSRLREFDLLQGRFPAKADEIAIDPSAKTTFNLAVGQKMSLLGKNNEPVPMTIVGVFSQGTSSATLYGQYVVLTPDALLAYATQPGFSSAVVAADTGVNQDELAKRIAAAVPHTKTMTGAEYTNETLISAGKGSASVTQFLLVFALISLVVAGMVIYNTFTILIAQRTRELALLRCVGAHRDQVFRSVLTEAVLMGLFASAIGFAAGIGTSALLQRLVASVGPGAGGSAVRVPITPSVVVASFAVGVVVTVLSAVVPAWRATRVAPLAALRSLPDGKNEVGRTGFLRIALVVLLALIGAGICVIGIRGSGSNNPDSLAFIVTGLGTMVLLSAVIVAGPLLVGPANQVLGVMPRWVFGVPAKLASANAVRNPKRTAATTAALMIGVTIVTMITATATSAKETVTSKIQERYPADYAIGTSTDDRLLPVALPQQLRASPQIESVITTTRTRLTVGSDSADVTAVDTDAINTALTPSTVNGDLNQLTTTGTIAMLRSTAQHFNVKLGDQIPVSSDSGKQLLTLVATYDIDDQHPAPPVAMTGDTLAKVAPAVTGYSRILVKAKPGVSPQDSQAVVDKLTDPIPVAKVDSVAANKTEVSSQVDSMLGMMWALVGLAVVIALFGIANTLSLSVLERTRESALLRALGLTRGQLRLMLLIEAALMGMLGAVLGVVLGGGFAYLVLQSISSKDLHMNVSLPVGQLVVLVVVAVVAALISALLPARRAARTPMVAGMAET